MSDITYRINVATANAVEKLLSKKSFVEAARIAGLNMSGDDRSVMLRRIIVGTVSRDYDLAVALNNEYKSEQGMWYGFLPSPSAAQHDEVRTDFDDVPKTVEAPCPDFAS